MWFLLEYDCQEGELKSLLSFPDSDRHEAFERLRDLELSQLQELQNLVQTGERPRMEYVVLGAESEAVIRVTHANYFESLKEIRARLSATQPRPSPETPPREFAIVA